MQKVLLTSIYIPLGNEKGEGKTVGSEMVHKSLTRSQGIFSIRQVIRCWSHDYIAVNLETPVTVLHYPTLGKLRKELRRNRYTHIGINFVVPTYHRMVKMVEVVREVSPETTIILGGYGTVLPDDVLIPHCHHICRGDGVPFMRKLLGEDVNAPTRHPYAPVKGPRVLSFSYPGISLNITAGLGCPNGCDFCSTSHFYSRHYYPLIKDGKELYHEVIRQYQGAHDRGEQVMLLSIMDEDLLHNETRARQFLAEARKHQHSIGIAGFASVKGLSKFTGREIAEMGFDLLWIGIEGNGAHFSKLAGRPIQDLFEDLKDHGVSIIGSSIIGLPYHNRENVWEDFHRHIHLAPTYSQILIYSPVIGTALYHRLKEENQLHPGVFEPDNWKRMDGFTQYLIHEHFEDGELEKIQEQMYQQEYERLGASIFRVAALQLRGVENLEKSDSPLLQMRAERLKKQARAIRPLLPLGKLLAPSGEARQALEELECTFKRVYGPQRFTDLIKSSLAPFLVPVTYLRSLSGYDERRGGMLVQQSQLVP